jgi:hypothetical protein
MTIDGWWPTADRNFSTLSHGIDNVAVFTRG